MSVSWSPGESEIREKIADWELGYLKIKDPNPGASLLIP